MRTHLERADKELETTQQLADVASEVEETVTHEVLRARQATKHALKTIEKLEKWWGE